MSESEIQQKIQMEAVPLWVHLMRNNSGAFKDATGRFVRFGLDNTSAKRNEQIKSSDLIGFTQVVIGPEHVGKLFAVFTAIEVKSEDWKPSTDKREKAQRAFIDWVIAKGGIAGICNSVESFRKIIGR